MQKKVKLENKYFFNLLVTIFLIFGSRYFLEFGAVTAYGSNILGIFLGVIYGYCTIGMIIPSFMALIAMSFSGYGSMSTILQGSFGNSTVIYIIAILILSAMLEKCGLADKIVHWMVTRKIAKGRPWVISFLFLFAAYIAALFINAVPVTFICWSLLSGLFATVGYQRGDRWPMAIMFGVMFTATLGSCVPSFQISIVSNFGLLTAVSGGEYHLNPLNYMLWAFLCSAALFAVYFIFMKYVLKPDVTLLKKEDLIKENQEALTWEQKFTAALFIIFVVGLLLPSLLPEGFFLKTFFTTIGDSGWSILITLVGIMVWHDGKQVYDFNEMFAKGVIWDIVLMIATIFLIVGAITEERTGIAKLIIQLVAPMQNALPPFIFILAISLVVILLCNFTNSVAVAYIFIPVMFMLSLDSEAYIDMMPFVGMTVFMGNLCFMMPSASIISAIMYSKPEWIPKKYCYIFSIFSIISVYLIMMLIGMPLGKLVL